MQQRMFFGKRRSWATPKKRKPRRIVLSERGIYEPVEREEDVLQEIVHRLWYSGIPVFREKERIPRCPHCHKFVTSAKGATQRGHPDLHGYVPARMMPTGQSMPFLIECKRPGGGIETVEQKEVIAKAKKDGVLAMFARSWKEVRVEFEQRGVVLRAAA